MREPHPILPRFAVMAGCLAFAVTLSLTEVVEDQYVGGVVARRPSSRP
jgi:hypothetical protein